MTVDRDRLAAWVRDLHDFAADLVDVDVDDRGGSRPTLGPRARVAWDLAGEAIEALERLAEEVD